METFNGITEYTAYELRRIQYELDPVVKHFDRQLVKLDSPYEEDFKRNNITGFCFSSHKSELIREIERQKQTYIQLYYPELV